MIRTTLRVAMVSGVFVLALCTYAAADNQPDYQYRDDEGSVEEILHEVLENSDMDVGQESGMDADETGAALGAVLNVIRENGVELNNASLSNYIAVLSESTIAGVAEESVDGSTVEINNERLVKTRDNGTSLQNNAARAAFAMEDVLELEGVDLVRELRRIATFNMNPDEAGRIVVVVDSDVLLSEIDSIRIKTPRFILELDIQNMEDDFSSAPDGKLKISAQEQYDDSGQLKVELQCPENGLLNPVRLCFYVDRNGADGMTGCVDTHDTNDKGLLTSFYDAKSETVNCLAAESGTYYLEGYSPRFSDIGNLKKEARDAIELLASKNIIRGYADGTFRPYNYVTRAQYVAMAMRTLGKDRDLHYKPDKPFDDVTPGKWYYHVVTNAQKMNLIKGFDEHTFGSDYQINAAQIYIVAGRILKNAYHYRTLNNYDEVLKEKFRGGYESYSNETRRWLAMSAKYGLVLEQSDRIFNGGVPLNRGNVAVVTKRIYKAGY